MTTQPVTLTRFVRDTFADLMRFLKEEWQWVVGFGALMAIKQLIPFLNFDFQEFANLLKASSQPQGDMAAATLYFVQHFHNIVLSVLAALMLSALSLWSFTVLYMKIFAQGQVEFSTQNFLFWLAKVVQKYLLLLAPFVILGIAYAIASKMLGPEPPHLLTASSVMLFVIWIFGSCYGVLRLFLVSPLAVLHRQPVIRTSARLTNNNVLRIWAGAIIVFLGLMLVAMPLALVHFSVMQTYGMTSVEAGTLQSVINGFVSSLGNATMTVYACVVYRHLSQAETAS
jgi:hypothetical protein